MPHLIVVGGGHAHVHVLKSLAMRPEPGLRVTLVSPHSYATYSGMVPGVLAGQYRLDEAQMDVRALAARAGAAFIPDRVVRIDPRGRRLELAARPPLSYDLLSLDIGSQPAGAERIAAGAAAVIVKPIEVAASGIQGALAAPSPPAGKQIVIVGAGAGGVEIAFAAAVHMHREGKGCVTLCDAEALPLLARGQRTARVVARALAEHGIQFIGHVEATAVHAGGVMLSDGRELVADLVVWATGAAGPALLADSNLPVDARGFLRVGNDLRCAEYPDIFAAGDCAALASYPELAKAGVHAVRQGPVLAHNLRAAARGGRLQVYTPQRRFLSLLNTGDGRAIFSYPGLAWRGRLAWRLKDRIDRAFVAKYVRPPLHQRDAMGGVMQPCGGCAAKVGADVLERVLRRLDVPVSEQVLIGLAPADDAAVFAHPQGMLAVATTDGFPPFSDDLYLVGQVAAVNAASDLYAMGAEGTAALAFVCLPEADAAAGEADLDQILRGALAALQQLDIPLVGGHTIAGAQAIVGFAMHGWVHPERVLRKAGARAGDILVLTKPLGTGVVLAAARAGFAAADWVEAAQCSMLRSNGPAMRLLVTHGVRACTDVTGFGLAGHLREMLRAGGVAARLTHGALPALPGTLELLRAGWRSSFHAANARAQDADNGDPLTALLVDPQTSGGLLAAVPAERIAALQIACAAAGEALSVIGEIHAGPPEWTWAE